MKSKLMIEELIEDDKDIVDSHRVSVIDETYNLAQYYNRKVKAYESMQGFDNESDYVECCAIHSSLMSIYEGILRLDNKRVDIQEKILYHLEENK